jgi:hypothetical protein
MLVAAHHKPFCMEQTKCPAPLFPGLIFWIMKVEKFSNLDYN